MEVRVDGSKVSFSQQRLVNIVTTFWNIATMSWGPVKRQSLQSLKFKWFRT